MKAKSCLRVTHGGTNNNGPVVTVVLTAVHTESSGRALIDFVGASCPASVQPGTRGHSSITFTMTRGESGIIALHMDLSHPKWPDQSFTAIIPISWDCGKVIVDLDNPFVSSTDCVGQVAQYEKGVVSNHDLRVTAGKKRFSTCSVYCNDDKLTSEKMQKLQADGYNIVSDARLLCRFLVGDATLDEVEKAVIAEPVDVAALQEQNALLSLEVATLKVDKESVIKRANQLNEMYQRAQGNLEALQSEHRKLQEAHEQIYSESCRDQVVLTSQARELSALKRARVKDMQTILGLTVNDGVLCAKVRFGGWSWVALKRVKTFAATALRGLELEASDRPDCNMA